jgi:hypothetical protein
MIRNLSYVDIDLASRVAVYLGISISKIADGFLNQSFLQMLTRWIINP